jgi:cytochrome c peroxidase
LKGIGTGSKRHFREPNDIIFVKRNSQSVLNTAFNGIKTGEDYHAEFAPMFWDMRVKCLEAQALEPIKTQEEMRGNAYTQENIPDEIIRRLRQIPEYRLLFSKAFRNDQGPVNETNLSKSIALRALTGGHQLPFRPVYAR